ncbi:solute carrier family 22 member 18 isoform X5 [Heterocephalus glaber]|uniref:Solute carrier family 22 member 18 n=1 Tax=Heterocephalus glaber TaxID=10181 RepID=A0AAX6TJD5_HETGA|nr:solute carrier family 22 member 18 isoform X5 [Heterocephalus glaber]
MQGASAHRTHQSLRTMGTLARPRVILLTYLLAAMELTCLFMQFSILPYLSRRLGLDSVAYGYLQTTFGVLQLLGGPVFGRFADQRGARAALSLSFLAASVFYLLLAAACSPALPGVLLLFASRLPSPFMHTLPAAQMIITDLTGPEERPAALGRLGLCFGVGIILGSLLGGTLSTSCGIHCPAIAAFMANLLGAVISFTCIPAKTKEASVDAQATQPGLPKASVFDLKAITRLLLLPSVLPVFLVKVASGFPSGLFMVMFSIISMDFFQLEASQAGYLMSFFGILQMVLMSNILHFCFLMPGLVFSLCSLNVVTDSMLTKAVSATDTGGLLYRNFGVPIFGHVQLAVNFLIFLFLWRKPMSQKGDKAK